VVVSVAAYRLVASREVTVRLDAARLGLPAGKWRVTDIGGGPSRTVTAGEPVQLTVRPHAAATVRVTATK